MPWINVMYKLAMANHPQRKKYNLSFISRHPLNFSPLDPLNPEVWVIWMMCPRRIGTLLGISSLGLFHIFISRGIKYIAIYEHFYLKQNIFIWNKTIYNSIYNGMVMTRSNIRWNCIWQNKIQSRIYLYIVKPHCTIPRLGDITWHHQKTML